MMRAGASGTPTDTFMPKHFFVGRKAFNTGEQPLDGLAGDNMTYNIETARLDVAMGASTGACLGLNVLGFSRKRHRSGWSRHPMHRSEVARWWRCRWSQQRRTPRRSWRTGALVVFSATITGSRVLSYTTRAGGVAAGGSSVSTSMLGRAAAGGSTDWAGTNSGRSGIGGAGGKYQVRRLEGGRDIG